MLSDDGFTVLLVQAVGRTKADSIERDDKPADSQVARTVVEENGAELDIFRRNTPYELAPLWARPGCSFPRGDTLSNGLAPP